MASILKVDTITGVTTAGSISVTGEGNSTTTNLQQGLAKVFVGFNASTAVEESLNVTSLTDVSAGKTNVNFSNNTATAGYAYQYSSNAGSSDDLGGDGPRCAIAARFTNYCYGITWQGSAYVDSKHNGVHVHGGLA